MNTVVVRDMSHAESFVLKHLPQNPSLFISKTGKRLAVWLINSAGFGELYTEFSVKRERIPYALSARVFESDLGTGEGVCLWET